MPESKIEITKRLQREGRWDEACEVRDRVRRELRQAGKTKGEANDEAWRRMSEEFQPVTVITQQGQSEVDPVADDGDEFPTNLPPSDGVEDHRRPCPAGGCSQRLGMVSTSVCYSAVRQILAAGH